VLSIGEGDGVISVNLVLSNAVVDRSDRVPGVIDKVFVLVDDSSIGIKSDIFIPSVVF
jgi:hypothetical protein